MLLTRAGAGGARAWQTQLGSVARSLALRVTACKRCHSEEFSPEALLPPWAITRSKTAASLAAICGLAGSPRSPRESYDAECDDCDGAVSLKCSSSPHLISAITSCAGSLGLPWSSASSPAG